MDNKDFNKTPFKLLAAGSIVAIVFTVIWMLGTYQLGVPSYFLLFGVVIILVAAINFTINWRNAKIHAHVQESLKAEEQLAFCILEEPTFVYRYCPSCGDAITNDEKQLCSICLEKINTNNINKPKT